jgi:hypothetical protein
LTEQLSDTPVAGRVEMAKIDEECRIAIER